MQYNSFQNGIGPSKEVQNTFDDLVNVDIHSEPGIAKPQNKLYQPSLTVNKPCYTALAPNGDLYLFSKTDGSIFKRTTAGVYSSVRTNSNGAHKSALYYRNYIYYTTDSKLGRFDLNSTWNDNYQLLTAGKPHPMEQFDLILYIADGYNIAQLDDAGVFTSSALDLPVEHTIKALKEYGDDILTLSSPGDYLNDSAIFRWDTFSDSWTIKDKIKEVDAYAFLDADNLVFALCLSGNVYVYNGSQLENFTSVRNPASTSGHQLTTNLKGKPLFANGGRIYSIHRASRNFNYVLCGEYTCSAGADATIHSIIAVGSQLIVSWEKSGAYGVDEISTDYADAELHTPRNIQPLECKVSYVDLPGDSSIEISTKDDGASTWTSQTVLTDTENREVITDDYLDPDSGTQAKIVLKSDGTDRPSINNIILE